MLPYSVFLPEKKKNGILFNSPHSGKEFPKAFLDQIAIDPALLLYSSDTLVDQLIKDVPRFGAIGFVNHLSRIYIDTNRLANEIDLDMFQAPLANLPVERSEKVARGFGVISRKSYNGLDIYAHKLPFQEVALRLEQAYHPVHQALTGLLHDLYDALGYYILIDCHSMPSYRFINPHLSSASQPDLIIGNRHHTSCHDTLSQHVARYFKDQGLKVTFNTPYAGGYNTEHYSNRDQRQQALQLEFNRALYLNEKTLLPSQDFDTLQKILTGFSKNLNHHRAELS